MHLPISYRCVCLVASVISDCLQPSGLEPARLLSLWDSPGKNTAVGYCSFPQPCPPPEDFPDPGVQPASLRPPALAGGFFTTWKPLVINT